MRRWSGKSGGLTGQGGGGGVVGGVIRSRDSDDLEAYKSKDLGENDAGRRDCSGLDGTEENVTGQGKAINFLLSWWGIGRYELQQPAHAGRKTLGPIRRTPPCLPSALLAASLLAIPGPPAASKPPLLSLPSS